MSKKNKCWNNMYKYHKGIPQNDEISDYGAVDIWIPKTEKEITNCILSKLLALSGNRDSVMIDIYALSGNKYNVNKKKVNDFQLLFLTDNYKDAVYSAKKRIDAYVRLGYIGRHRENSYSNIYLTIAGRQWLEDNATI